MNLLDRIKSGSLVLMILIFFACEQDDGDLNVNIDNTTNVTYTEFELPVTNIRIDSLRTDNVLQVLVGNYQDPNFSEISAKSYVEFRYDSGAYLADTLSLDSVVFTLDIESFLSEETLADFAFELSYVADTLFGQAVYVAEKEVAVEDGFLDTLALKVNQFDTAVSFEIPRLGRLLYSELRQLEQAEYSIFRKQMAIIPRELNDVLLAFNILESNSKIEIFTRDDSDSLFVTRLDFTGVHYSNVTRDWSQSEWSGTQDLDTFDIDDNYTVVNPLHGIFTVVDFSQINTFLQENRYLVLNEVEFEVDLNAISTTPIEGLSFYAFKPNYGIRGEGMEVMPLAETYEDRLTSVSNDILLTNRGYSQQTTGLMEPIVSELNEGKYVSDITLATEYLHLEYHGDDRVPYDKVVIISDDRLSFRESLLSTFGVKVKVFYTQVN